jgi:hypothetical protein
MAVPAIGRASRSIPRTEPDCNHLPCAAFDAGNWGVRRTRINSAVALAAAGAAHLGVEADDIERFCLGGEVIGSGLALELVQTFLHAHFSGAARHHLAKVQALEPGNIQL